MYIKKHFKKIIAGIGAALLMVGGSLPILDSEPLTINEYQELVKLYDYEIKVVGGMNFTNVDPTDFSEIMPELNKKIRARELFAEELMILQAQGLTKQDYKKDMDTLMKKVEKTTLLKKLIK